jgi:hypothetical protein
MPDWWSAQIKSPYYWLAVAAIFFAAAVVWTYTGKAWIRFHGWVYRAEEPKRYWMEVAAYYLIAVFFIAVFLYTIT